MTMTANFVSSQYLANAMVAPVNQAQSSLATATQEMSTGQYSDLGLQLGDQSGYELSLKQQASQIDALTASNAMLKINVQTARIIFISFVWGHGIWPSMTPILFHLASHILIVRVTRSEASC